MHGAAWGICERGGVAAHGSWRTHCCWPQADTVQITLRPGTTLPDTIDTGHHTPASQWTEIWCCVQQQRHSNDWCAEPHPSTSAGLTCSCSTAALASALLLPAAPAPLALRFLPHAGRGESRNVSLNSLKGSGEGACAAAPCILPMCCCFASSWRRACRGFPGPLREWLGLLQLLGCVRGSCKGGGICTGETHGPHPAGALRPGVGWSMQAAAGAQQCCHAGMQACCSVEEDCSNPGQGR